MGEKAELACTDCWIHFFALILNKFVIFSYFMFTTIFSQCTNVSLLMSDTVWQCNR